MRRHAGRFVCLVAGMVAAMVHAAPSGRARAASDLDAEMTVVARQIKLLLDQRGHDAIAVGEFRGPASLASSAGPALTKALSDELRKLDVGVKRQAALEVNGEYRDVEDQRARQLAVQIKAHIVDRSGAELAAFEPRGIFNMTTIASLVGATVALPANASDEARDKTLTDAVDHPKVHLAQTRIAAAPGSPYAIEILVKTGPSSRPRAASKDPEGYAFLKIKRGEAYEVKLINDSPHDAAVTLTIDGLNVFAFSGNKGYTHWIVPSKGTLTVPGWHRTNKVSDSFLVTEYARGAAAEKLPSSASVGTITAAFAAAWPKDAKPPEDEAAARPGSRSGDATGKGPPVRTDFQEVVRVVGRLRDAVSVRYTREADPKDLPDSRP
jgi:hypothetical protein